MIHRVLHTHEIRNIFNDFLKFQMTAANMVEVMTKLLDCNYPFQWQPRVVLEIIPNDMVNRITDQLNEKIWEDDFYFEL